MLKKLIILLSILLCTTANADWLQNWSTGKPDYYEKNGGWTDGKPNPYVTDITDEVGIGTTSPIYRLDVLGSVGIGSVTPADTLYINAGKVGIGTIVPAAPIDIRGVGITGVAVDIINSGIAVTSVGGLTLSASSPTVNNYIGVLFADNIGAVSGASGHIGMQLTDRDSHYGDISFATRSAGGYTEKMRITSNGNVGVGTTVPVKKLDVLGTVGIGTVTAGADFIVNLVGNVGIGSTAPLAKLDVNGASIRVDSNTVTLSDTTDGYQLTFDTATNTWAGEAAGGAGGGAANREITFLPGSAGIGTTNPALIDWVNSTGTGLSRFSRAKFDDGDDDTLHFSFVMPSDATASADWTLDIYWYSDEDVAEDVVWAVQVSATTANDADNVEEQAADTADTVTDSADLTEAKALNLATITIDYANCDGAVAGDTVELIFYRDGDNGSDNHTNECYLYKLHLKIPRS